MSKREKNDAADAREDHSQPVAVVPWEAWPTCSFLVQLSYAQGKSEETGCSLLKGECLATLVVSQLQVISL